MTRYALTIFLSACLLFQVQPLIAKKILPWFGGGPAVWTTCMLFFQLLLLLGYTYAHVLSQYDNKTQRWIHILLLIAALLTLPIEPSVDLKPVDSDFPSLRILTLLALSVGLPYLLLSTTGPLVQRWFAMNYPNRSPYRLFALSNAGSLLALLSYPVVFEPYLSVHSQMIGWSMAFIVYACLSASCAWTLTNNNLDRFATRQTSDSSKAKSRPAHRQVAIWIGLSAMPSLMLLATTNQISQEVAVVPFLWVIPLSLYLISFILCFDSDKWYSRRLFAPALFVSSGLAVWCLIRDSHISLVLQLLIYCSTLFLSCMTCHGELAKSRPTSDYLTGFYLAISIGGALGGIFAAWVAPHIFSGFFEYHVGLIGCIAVTLIAWFYAKDPALFAGRSITAWAGVTLVCFIIEGLAFHIWQGRDNVLDSSRNFYGVLTVKESEIDPGKYRTLQHGRIAHGYQFLDEERPCSTSSYYGEDSGLGIAILNHPKRTVQTRDPMHIGVIGLGTGTIASYGRAQDTIRFYEINPDVETAANEYFTYLSSCPTNKTIVLGDARVMLERELMEMGPQQFDILAIDAFSSDAIPMHLLTKESFELYEQHLAHDGVLAVHISNRYLNLRPVVKTLAESHGYEARLVEFEPKDENPGRDLLVRNSWVLIAKSPTFFDSVALETHWTPWDQNLAEILWTDDFGSLWPIFISPNNWLAP
jgi:hypothetical protein